MSRFKKLLKRNAQRAQHKAAHRFRFMKKRGRFSLSGIEGSTMAKPSEIAFAKWLQRNDPFLFDIAKKRVEIQKSGTINGLGFLTDINWGDLAKSAVETVKNIAPSLVQYKAQSKLLKTQLKRAETGLPPLNAAEYAPVLKVEPSLSPETEAAAARIATQSVNSAFSNFGQMLPMLAIGGAAIYFMTRPKGRRR